VLVSRTPEKLAVLAAQIASTHAVATHALAMDFAAPDAAAQAALAALLAPLDIAILINNVGRSHAMPVPFALTEPAERDAIIEINCASTLRTTALVLPGMLARRRGLVLTMGSFAALVPTPLLATYSGSKAFLQHWSTALGAEVAAQGVVVELVQSYLVTSAMSKVRRPSLLVPAPRAFVRSVLAKLGRSGGAQGWAYTSTPFWSHGAMQWALGATVGFMGRMAVRQNMVLHESIRKRALRKVQREAGAGKKGN
jgi:17beta-estradiol 17-dehydrogenase / very-long-chain 3-oxoacyl-CoA reductase